MNQIIETKNNVRDNTPAGTETIGVMPDNARRAGLWVAQYWKALFDFTFEKYMIFQVLPILYGMMLFTLGVAILYVIVETFLSGSHWRGFFYLFFAGPLAFVVLASILRALLEFYMVIFRIAEDVDELVGMRDTVDKLSGLHETVNDMASLTRRIPFWKLIVGRRPSASRKLSTERRDAEQKTGDAGPRDNSPGA